MRRTALHFGNINNQDVVRALKLDPNRTGPDAVRCTDQRLSSSNTGSGTDTQSDRGEDKQ